MLPLFPLLFSDWLYWIYSISRLVIFLFLIYLFDKILLNNTDITTCLSHWPVLKKGGGGGFIIIFLDLFSLIFLHCLWCQNSWGCYCECNSCHNLILNSIFLQFPVRCVAICIFSEKKEKTITLKYLSPSLQSHTSSHMTFHDLEMQIVFFAEQPVFHLKVVASKLFPPVMMLNLQIQFVLMRGL